MPPHIHSWRDLLRTKGYRSSIRGALRYFFGKRGQRLVTGLRLFYRVRATMLMRSTQPIGRLTRGHQVRVWVDGREAFRRLEKLLRQAQHSIAIQMFIWKDDETGRQIAKTLLDAADRGVQIDITKEAVGDFFEFRGDFLSTQQSIHPVWQKFWRHPRIRITHATNKDHAKVYVIDSDTLLLTGMNIGNEYRYEWHDYMVELRGEAFVRQFLTRENIPSIDNDISIVMNSEERKEIRPFLRELIASARESIVIEQCYFSDEEVLNTLIQLSHKGVHLTVIIPETIDFLYHANMLSIGRLLTECKKSHVRIFIYPGTFHAKAILVDRTKAFIGSANLYTASIDEMGEMNVFIQRRYRALWKIRESLRHDILHSRSISGPPRSLWISRWLAWLGL